MDIGLVVSLYSPKPTWLCNPQCHVTRWDWVNNGFTVGMQSTMSCDHMGLGEQWIHCGTQSHVIMQSTMSCDHMGLGEQWIH